VNTTAGSVGVTGSVAVAEPITVDGTVSVTEPVTVDGTVAVSGVSGTVTTAIANTRPRRAATMNGEPVAAQSGTILSGLATYNIPTDIYRTGTTGGGNGTITSVDGMFRFTSGTVSGGIVYLETVAHPRYEPDHQFGWKIASNGMPALGSSVKIRFGLFTTWEGFYVEYTGSDGALKSYTRRTTGIVAPSPEDHTSGLGAATITTTERGTCTLPAGCVLTKATLYDQYVQWRGVGDILVLLNLVEAHITSRLGVASDFWSGNPALPFRIEVEATANNASSTVRFGCFDVATFDGGESALDKVRTYRPIAVPIDPVTVDNTERPILVIQAAGFLGGMPCTRDHFVESITGLTVDAAATVRIRYNATISNAGVTWSIPESTRGIVKGVGSNTATVSGGTVLWSKVFTAGQNYDLDNTKWAPTLVAPVPGTLTTGANRGNPAYGDTFCVTVQKSTGGSAIADAALLVRSVY
jgi:hypothetical protein